ncbi:hypothetical protein [Bradyrhizobium roseum]|uniref:hypothetical protein n=1 Tax=Bradyrhizobium roseum TaxID=3056648 RepID=UPI00263A03CA|nr:hypothetical protein [Bradyrhizobium roseus]WKA30939.1 hypothetical protein QUH67_12485 [Bradyrhizobium roseus]
MVSAVSSQAATLNPLAYPALDGDDGSKQPTPNATTDDSDRGPATQVSLSPDALDRLKAALKQDRPDAPRQAAVALSQASEDRFQANIQDVRRRAELAKINFQFKMLDHQDAINKSFTASLKFQKDDLEKWQNTAPVPAVQLTEAQIVAILKKVAPRGIDSSKIGGADNYSFGDDGKIYTFRKDGTAWVHEAGVPTSEEQKEYVVQEANKSMAYQSTRIQDTSAARATLTAQLNALIGQ